MISEQARLLLLSTFEVESRSVDAAVFRVDLDPAEPLFAGHYPGQAILPGVCLVECADRGVRLVAPETFANATLEQIESARFLKVMGSSDRISVTLRWTDQGPHWRLMAEFSVGSVQTGRLRLRYGKSVHVQ